MKPAQPATGPTASPQPTQPSFDLASYVAGSGTSGKEEVGPWSIPSGGVAFCALGAFAVVPFTSASAGIATKVNTGDMNLIDVGGDGANNFQISVGASAVTETLKVLGTATNNRAYWKAYRVVTDKTVGTGGGKVYPSGSGATIFAGTWSLTGSFQAGPNNYVPVSFTDSNINSGNKVYGWAQINVKADSDIVKVVYSDSGLFVNLNNGAFTEVGGGGGGGGVPEPSTLALMATGAAGVLALRKRRRQQKEGK